MRGLERWILNSAVTGASLLIALGLLLVKYYIIDAQAREATPYHQDDGSLGGKQLVLIPMTLRKAMRVSSRQSPARQEAYLKMRYSDIMGFAEQSAVDLLNELGRYGVACFNNGFFFLLFFNLARTEGCPRQFLLQRVRVTKKFYAEGSTAPYHVETTHLVEAIRLNRAGSFTRPDRHFRCYTLDEVYRRIIVLECEIGWGEIPQVAEGRRWPFENHLSYRRLQDYAVEPDLYHRIRFDFSRTYTTIMEMDRSGRFQVEWPLFLQNAGRARYH